jgi:hypothetical protein
MFYQQFIIRTSFVNIRTLPSGWMMEQLQQTATISRRNLGCLLMALLFGGPSSRRARATTPPLLAVDRLVEGLSATSATRRSLSYRADAVILVLSLPVYRRTDVGSGFASLAEVAREDGRSYSLRFAGSSRPERAAGLDRMGTIHEAVIEQGAALSEAAYFGVLTSSPEETLVEGRRSLGKSAGRWNEYTAIDGHSRCGLTRSAVTHFRLPSSGAPNTRIIGEARASLQASRATLRESQWTGHPAGQAPPTFLYTLMRALQLRQRTSDSWYVYSERSYSLRLEKEPDRQQGLHFAERGLTSRPEHIIQVRGRIREERSGRQTTFRLWIEEGPANALPLRIEFQPRSYLRLSFEVDPKASPTPFQEDL